MTTSMIAVPAINFFPAQCTATRPSKWLFNPVIDLLFCCGGLVWILVVLHYLVAPQAFQSGPNAVDIIPLLSTIGTILLSDTHNAATLFRLYGSKDMRRKHSWIAYAGGGAALAFMTLLLFSPSILSLSARIYLLVVVYHVLAQLYGLTLMYCRMQGYDLNNSERRILKLSIDSLALYTILCQFAYAENFRHTFFGVTLPFWSGLSKTVLLGSLGIASVFLIAFSCMVVRKWRNSKQMLPLPAAVLLATGLLIASIVHSASGVLSLYIPIFFHGLQYLMVTLSAHLRDAKAVGSAASAGSEQSAWQDGLKYFGTLLSLTFIVFALCPQVICLTARIKFGTAFLAVFLALNFHHILTDSFIWRKKIPADSPACY